TITVAGLTGANTFVAKGFRTGMVIRGTTGMTAASLNRNLYVLSVADTVLKVMPLDYVAGTGAKLTGETASGVTLSVPGKRIIVPSSAHTNVSFGIEEFHTDITLSRFFTGCKPTQMALRLPATGMATVDFTVLGRNMAINTAQQYTTPTAATTSGIAAAPQGAVFMQGAPVGLITGMDVTIVGGHTSGTVIGSLFTPDIFQGRVRGSGQMTVYLQDETYLQYFAAETECEAGIVLNATSALDSPFTVLHLPRIKFGGGTVDDGEKGLIITMPFTVVKKGTATGYDSTTVSVQDSLFQ
ncbi:MAG TPA: phage tail tube protein, partial [Burkholderiaceae bacterium]|nr:phage tail tube protein [Burkholderiaceae bacterium]